MGFDLRFSTVPIHEKFLLIELTYALGTQFDNRTIIVRQFFFKKRFRTKDYIV